MERSKYPLEKLVYSVASVIPGFTALLTFQVAAPGSFSWFFRLSFLGYGAKLAVIVLVAFVVGFSMTTFLRVVLNGLGGAIRSQRPRKSSYVRPIAPWRDPRWRMALKGHLGSKAPEDTVLMTEELFDLKRKALELQPEPARSLALKNLNIEKSKTELDDFYWAQWYDHFHRIVLEPSDRDFAHMWSAIDANFGTAGLFVLLSSILIPSLRHWWSLVPAVGWTIVLIGQEYTNQDKYKNQWSTLSTQIKYLFETHPIPKATRVSAATSAFP
jgi:hypothetical protein